MLFPGPSPPVATGARAGGAPGAVPGAAPAPCILALDEGATNAKAHAIAPDGSILASGSAAVVVSHLRPGWVERDAEAVWAAQTAAIRDCLADAVGPPASTAISNQRESVVAARELLA